MNILLWPERFWPHIGGIEIICKEFAENLKKLGYKITVFTTHHPERKLPDFEELGGIPVHRFNFHTSVFNNDIKLINQIVRKVSELKKI